jgi:hypothetical protein
MMFSEIIGRLEREYAAEVRACIARVERGHSDMRELRFQNRKAVERYRAEIRYAERMARQSLPSVYASPGSLQTQLTVISGTEP